MAARGTGRRRAARGGGRAQIELRVAAPLAAHAARVVREAASAWAGPGEALSLSLVTDREMRTLNRAWRGKDRATDVLSWPPDEVVISLQTARRQAREGGWPLRTELRRLLAHGLAHCRGFDHQHGRGVREMAAEEERMLGKRGMVGEAFTQGKKKASRLARRPLSR